MPTDGDELVSLIQTAYLPSTSGPSLGPGSEVAGNLWRRCGRFVIPSYFSGPRIWLHPPSPQSVRGNASSNALLGSNPRTLGQPVSLRLSKAQAEHVGRRLGWAGITLRISEKAPESATGPFGHTWKCR